jgi:hypothetical protein
MPTTVRLARCAAKAGHSHWEPTSSTARPKWVVVGLTRLRAEPENMDAGHTAANAAVDSKYSAFRANSVLPLIIDP